MWKKKQIKEISAKTKNRRGARNTGQRVYTIKGVETKTKQKTSTY